MFSTCFAGSHATFPSGVSTFEGGIPDIVDEGETGFGCPKMQKNCLKIRNL